MSSFTIAELNDLIVNKQTNYILNFGKYPNYIKLPLAVYNGLIMVAKMRLTNDFFFDNDIVRYKKMILCPTVSIETIDEIEVF